MADEDQGFVIAVDNDTFTMDDLTFRERKELRRLARELAGDPELEMEDVLFDDLTLAFAIVVKRRADPDFAIDDALDLKPGDLRVSQVEKKPRPTRGAAKTVK